jgi:hypothetical protein
MAHFAQLDENNVVMQVIVVNNNDCLDENGVESESVGAEFCKNLFGGNWIQTSYNKKFRKNYAGIGYIYRSDIDAFILPQPYPSWLLNSELGIWEAPVPLPSDATPDNPYQWDEATTSWVRMKNGN